MRYPEKETADTRGKGIGGHLGESGSEIAHQENYRINGSFSSKTDDVGAPFKALQCGLASFDEIVSAIGRSPSKPALEEVSRQVARAYAAGGISENQAQSAWDQIEARRAALHSPIAGGSFRKTSGVNVSRYLPRKRPRSPDRAASRERRRTLGGSGFLPPGVREKYTEGERAVLTIVAHEVKRHGICDLPVDKIAALAGCGRTTVQNALHEARRLGHVTILERPRPGQKNLPNVVRIVAKEWLTWIKRGPSPLKAIGSNFQKNEHHEEHRMLVREKEAGMGRLRQLSDPSLSSGGRRYGS